MLMNSIYSTLCVYYNAGFIHNKPSNLIIKLKHALKKLNIGLNSHHVFDLKSSIQYPLVNGKFVIILDRSTSNEFVDYLHTSTIPHRLKVFVKEFYLRIQKEKQSQINVHSFSLPTFSHKKLNYKKNTIPKLTTI